MTPTNPWLVAALAEATPGRCILCDETLPTRRPRYCSTECKATANREYLRARRRYGAAVKRPLFHLLPEERRELRARALALLAKGHTGADVARTLEVKPDTVLQWASRARRANAARGAA